MGRAPCCDEKLALKKGPWTPDEDLKLVAYIQEHGHGSWRALPERAGLARCGKSCRLRWTNYLRPDIKRGRFSHDEDQMIIQLHAILGNRWSAIASHLPRRTDNEIKNYWNTHLKKRLSHMGVHPSTHKTTTAGLALSPAWTPLVSTQLTHMTQWDCALAEAQARLSQTPLPNSVADLPPHPSAFFMRSWKTKVEDTLRPAFGPVKLEPRIRINQSPETPVRPKVLPDWNAALGIRDPFLQKWSAMATTSEPTFFTSRVDAQDKPELLVDMFGDVSASARSENLFSFGASEGVGLENHFSPTSILQGPESDSSSPCGSGSGDSDCFEFLGSYNDFPLISGGSEHAESAAMSVEISEEFWHGEELAVAEMSTGAEGGLELVIPLDFSNGDDFDPQFESLCQGAHFQAHSSGV